MKVLVDTDVWSEAFRKKEGIESAYVKELKLLIEESRVQLIGIIRMEILCGLRSKSTFDKIESKLNVFPDRELNSAIFVLAAQFFNLCRSKGIQGSNNDFIICACSAHWGIPILSKDQDYLSYSKYLPIELSLPRKG
jgi:predicted nucleic acid-binding protein